MTDTPDACLCTQRVGLHHNPACALYGRVTSDNIIRSDTQATPDAAALRWIEAVHGCAKIEGDHKKQRICETILAALRAKPSDVVNYGWVFYGPDGEWHWSEVFDPHESITDQRPATAVEAALALRHVDAAPTDPTAPILHAPGCKTCDFFRANAAEWKAMEARIAAHNRNGYDPGCP